jgi:hypothetical protein
MRKNCTFNRGRITSKQSYTLATKRKETSPIPPIKNENSFKKSLNNYSNATFSLFLLSS